MIFDGGGADSVGKSFGYSAVSERCSYTARPADSSESAGLAVYDVTEKVRPFEPDSAAAAVRQAETEA